MYTVKKLAPKTVLKRTEINVGIVRAALEVSPGTITYAVVDEAGQVVKNGPEGHEYYEMYSRKYVAQREADYLNRKAQS